MLLRLGLVFLLQKSAVNALMLCVLSVALSLFWGCFRGYIDSHEGKGKRNTTKRTDQRQVCAFFVDVLYKLPQSGRKTGENSL